MASLSPHDRWYRGAQLVILFASAIGAVVAGRRMLVSPPVWNDDPGQWAGVAGIATAVIALVIARWPRNAAAAVAIACVAAATALLMPGPVAVCALLLTGAFIVGQSVPGGSERGATVATLVGVSIAIGAFAATAQLRIHYAAVHAAIAIVVILAGRASLRTAIQRMATTIAHPRTTPLTERMWIGIAGIVALIHIVVAARPETGYDASTMHLQFAEHVAADHSFRFGVDRYLWSTMPLGADYMFASAYLLGGEGAARALNLAFGALAASLVYQLARTLASREIALASATLFAAMPLAMLVTGSLFSESLWLALLLASLVVALGAIPQSKADASRRNDASVAWLPSLALLAGGAMATKVMSAAWLAVLVPVALWLAFRNGSLRSLTRRDIAWITAGVVIGAWAYVRAWILTGNPVFPFMNALFGSPLFDTAASFNNPLYNTEFRPWTPWQLVLRSARFIEGRDGAIGLAWLFVVPLYLLHLLRKPSLRYAFMAVLAIVFFIAIYTQQSYLRYLMPALALTAVLASAPLDELAASAGRRAILVVAGIALVAFDVRSVASASYHFATPCRRCLYDAGARERLVAEYAPLRAVSARLNRELPRARIGFLTINEPAPAGYVGYARAANWHDHAFFTGVIRASNADELAALVRKFELTHVVYRIGDDPASKIVAGYVAKYATPLWREGDFGVAAVQPTSGGGAAP